MQHDCVLRNIEFTAACPPAVFVSLCRTFGHIERTLAQIASWLGSWLGSRDFGAKQRALAQKAAKRVVIVAQSATLISAEKAARRNWRRVSNSVN